MCDLVKCPRPPERWAEAEGTEIQAEPATLSQLLGQFDSMYFIHQGSVCKFLLPQSICHSMKEVEGAVSCVALTVFISARLCTAADGETELVQHAWVGVGVLCHPNGSCYCNHRDGSRVSRGCPLCPAPHCLVPGQIKGKCCLWRLVRCHQPWATAPAAIRKNGLSR